MFFSFYGGLKFCWDFVSTFFVKTRTLEGCCYVLNGGDSLAPFKICLYLIYLYVYLSIRMYLWASVCRRTTSPKSIFRASRQMSATCPKKRYQKEKVLGEGTFGIVNKAKDTKTGQYVAIKKVRMVTATNYLAPMLLFIRGVCVWIGKFQGWCCDTCST